MSTEPQVEKKRVSLAKAFEALQAGPIYQVRVSPAPAVKQPDTVARVTRSSAPREDEIDEGSKEEMVCAVLGILSIFVFHLCCWIV